MKAYQANRSILRTHDQEVPHHVSLHYFRGLAPIPRRLAGISRIPVGRKASQRARIIIIAEFSEKATRSTIGTEAIEIHGLQLYS